jgi:transcriptional regulator with XRE-family HTH domain
MPQKDEWMLRQKITGVILRQARLDAGKTLKQCGQFLGLSSGAISAIEHGKRAISLPEVEMLAYYLEVPLSQLINGDGESASLSTESLPSEQLLLLRHRIVGALLRQARLEHDLSQAELAKNVGVSKRRVSQYELGERPVPLVELEAIAETLELPLTHFLDEGVGPVGAQQKREKEWQQLTELPDEVRSFVLEPTNLSYLELAMSLSAIPADKLRNIAASLLEITL